MSAPGTKAVQALAAGESQRPSLNWPVLPGSKAYEQSKLESDDVPRTLKPTGTELHDVEDPDIRGSIQLLLAALTAEKEADQSKAIEVCFMKLLSLLVAVNIIE